jgi:predicted negative regulator of RcsB-dependent stress response
MTSPHSAATSHQDFDLAVWATQNWRKLAIGGGIVAVVGLASWAYITSEARKEAFASQELMQARASAEAGNMPLAASDLTRMIDRYKGTKAADEGAILLNQIRLVQGQRDVAVNALREFLQGGHPDFIKASAYALLGAGLEDQGKAREAAQAYADASRSARLDFLKAQYLMDAGRTFTLAGDSTAAKDAYNEVLTKYGRLDQAAEARVRMAELGGTVPPPPPPSDSASG